VKKNLKISIITPSYNQGRFIERTIKSVLDQNYPNLEYIVVDGGSTDNTIKILKKYSKKIFWKSEKDKGQTNAINKGLAIASGNIIGYLNSDDTLEPGALQIVANYFNEHPKEKFVYGLGKLIDENDQYIGDYHNEPADFNSLFISCDISQPSAFWRKSLSDEIGPFNEKFDYAMDYEYWIRVSKKYSFNFINQYLSNTRIHSSTKTISQAVNVYHDIFKINNLHYNRVADNWFIYYSDSILSNINKKTIFSKLIYCILQLLVVTFLEIKYNHSLIPKRQLLYILHLSAL